MQLLNLAFAPRLTVSINPRIESPRRMLHQLLLPRVNLIGMNLVALSKIGHRCLFPQRLQRYPRLQRRVDPPSRLLHHFRSSPSGAADYPIMPLVPKSGSTSKNAGVSTTKRAGNIAPTRKAASPVLLKVGAGPFRQS